MTVAELIQILLDLDPTLKVLVSGYESGANEVQGFMEADYEKNEEDGWYAGEFQEAEGVGDFRGIKLIGVRTLKT